MVVFTNKVGMNSQCFAGVFNKTISPLVPVGYETIIVNSALHAVLAIYRSGSPICLITSMITDQIGRHQVLLPINHNFNKIFDI